MSIRTPEHFSSELLSSQLDHSQYLYKGVVLFQYKTLHFPLLNFVRSPLSHFSNPSTLSWIAAHSSGATTWTWVYIHCLYVQIWWGCPQFQDINVAVKQYWSPYCWLWGTPLATGIHLDFVLLITICWENQSVFCPCIWSVLYQYISENIMGNNDKNFTKDKVTIHCSLRDCLSVSKAD